MNLRSKEEATAADVLYSIVSKRYDSLKKRNDIELEVTKTNALICSNIIDILKGKSFMRGVTLSIQDDTIVIKRTLNVKHNRSTSLFGNTAISIAIAPISQQFHSAKLAKGFVRRVEHSVRYMDRLYKTTMKNHEIIKDSHDPLVIVESRTRYSF